MAQPLEKGKEPCPTAAGWRLSWCRLAGTVDELRPAVVVGGILVELSEVPTGAMAGEGSPIPHLGPRRHVPSTTCSQHHLQECRSHLTQVCQPVFGRNEALGRKLQVFVEDLEGRTASRMSAGVLAPSGTGEGGWKGACSSPDFARANSVPSSHASCDLGPAQTSLADRRLKLGPACCSGSEDPGVEAPLLPDLPAL